MISKDKLSNPLFVPQLTYHSQIINKCQFLGIACVLFSYKTIEEHMYVFLVYSINKQLIMEINACQLLKSG